VTPTARTNGTGGGRAIEAAVAGSSALAATFTRLA
jgi:hypothetical protein